SIKQNNKNWKNMVAKSKENLLKWCQDTVKQYGNKVVQIDDFSVSWKDGSAFVAITHAVFPDEFNLDQMLAKEQYERLKSVFNFIEDKGIVGRLLEPEDFVGDVVPEKITVETYISCIFHFQKKKLGDDQLDAQLKSLLENINNVDTTSEDSSAAGWSLQTMDKEIEALNSKMKMWNESQKVVEKRRNESAQSKEILNNLEKIMLNIEQELIENESSSVSQSTHKQRRFREEIEKREQDIKNKIEREKEQFDNHISELQKKIEALKANTKEQEELKQKLEAQKKAKDDLLRKRREIEEETAQLKQRLLDEEKAKLALQDSMKKIEEEKELAKAKHKEEVKKLREELNNSHAKTEEMERELRNELLTKGDLIASEKKLKFTVSDIGRSIDLELKEKAEIQKTKEKLTFSLKKAIMTLDEETQTYNLRDKSKKEIEAEKNKLRAEREAEHMAKIQAEKEKRIAQNEYEDKNQILDVELVRVRDAKFLNKDLERKIEETTNEIEDERDRMEKLLIYHDEKFSSTRDRLAKKHENVLKKIEESKQQMAKKKQEATESIVKERDTRASLENEKIQLVAKDGELSDQWMSEKKERKQAMKANRSLEDELNRARQFLDLENKGRASREKFKSKLEQDAKGLQSAISGEQTKRSQLEEKKTALEKDQEALAKKLSKAKKQTEELEEARQQRKSKSSDIDKKIIEVNATRLEAETNMDIKILQKVSEYQVEMREKKKLLEEQNMQLNTKAYLAAQKLRERSEELAQLDEKKAEEERQLKDTTAKLEEIVLEKEATEIKRKKLEEDVKKAMSAGEQEKNEHADKKQSVEEMRKEIELLQQRQIAEESEAIMYEKQAKILADELAEHERQLKERADALEMEKAEADRRLKKDLRRLEKEMAIEQSELKQELLDDHKEKLQSIESKFNRQQRLLEEEYGDLSAELSFMRNNGASTVGASNTNTNGNSTTPTS
ncbi:hypothetical protein SAMD00019534_005400, partial [Acytostelium subglobosum LB1]|uniref:hypothetical protein n=1 Tax=Acytostelium subglobosum LB1 TaxID=1410327 RepID=UPI000644F994